MKKKQSNHWRSVPGMLLGALMFTSVAAYSQDNETENPEFDLEEILVVTGIRGSLLNSRNLKRDSGAIVDAITAEDVGKFPDKNVADSLSRMSGISVTRDFGESEKVNIRGTATTQSRTLLNGMAVASTDWFTLDEPSRGFNYLVLPSSLIKTLEVYKSPQANIQEGSLGGTVYVKTRTPLDMDANTFFFNLEGQYSDNSEKTDPQASFMYSWKNDSETFGALISYSYQKRQLNRFGRETIAYDTPDNSATGLWQPRVIGQTDFRQERERQTFFGSFQVRPTDGMTMTLNILDTNMDTDNVNQNSLATLTSDGGVYATDTNGDPLVATAGSGIERGVVAGIVDASAGGAGGRFQILDRKSKIDVSSYDFTLENVTGRLTSTFRLGTTESEGGAPDEQYWGFSTQAGGAANIDGIVFDQDLSFTLFTDIANGVVQTEDDFLSQEVEFTFGQSTTNKDKEDYLSADFEVEMDTPFLTRLSTGLLHRDHEKSRFRTLTRYNWFADSDHIDFSGDWWGADPANLENNATNWYADTTAGSTVGDFFTGSRGEYNPLIDTGLARSITVPTDPTAAGTFPLYNESWGVQEEILATYVKADFEVNNLRGDLGIRYVTTDVKSSGYSIAGDPAGAALTETDNYQMVAMAFGCQGPTPTSPNPSTVITCSAERTTVDHDYSEFLPNVNLVYEANEDLQVRFSAAKVMTRPDYQRIALTESYFIQTRAGTRGNPNLDPSTAYQYDVGIEWYFNEESLFGVTIFHKDISGLISATNVTENRLDPEDLSIVPISFSTFSNGQDAKINGLELNYLQTFGNFGLTGNYTWTDADTSPSAEWVRDVVNNPGSGVVAGNSKHTFNATAFYENDLFDVRLSYNYRSEYLNEAFYFGQEIWTDDYGQLDFSASIRPLDILEVYLQVVNLTDEKTEQFHLDEARSSYIYDNDQRVSLGVNLRF